MKIEVNYQKSQNIVAVSHDSMVHFCSCIYNYLCNLCLSPLTLLVWIPLSRGVLDTTLSLSATRCFSPGTQVSSTNKKPQINWNIVKSGIKHHNPNTISFKFYLCIF